MCEEKFWNKIRVKFNIPHNQESFYLIIQVTYSEKNYKNKLWGIGNFEINTNYCERLFCDEDIEWVY